MNKIFPDLQKIDDADKERILGHNSNYKKLIDWLRKHPDETDVKNALVLEVARGFDRRNAHINALIVHLTKFERARIESRIPDRPKR